MSQRLFGKLTKPMASSWEYRFSVHAIKIHRNTKYTDYIKNSIKILSTQMYNLATRVLLY